MDEFQKVFEDRRVVDVEHVELTSYHLKGVFRIWHDQWKKNRAEGAPPLSWAMFGEAFLWCFFPCELREAKVREFLESKTRVYECASVQPQVHLAIPLCSRDGG